MPKNCAVYGCSHNQSNTKLSKPMITFYPFPKKKYELERRKLWTIFTKRKNAHFIGNLKSQDPRNVNFNPTIHPLTKTEVIKEDQGRSERAQKRRKHAEDPYDSSNSFELDENLSNKIETSCEMATQTCSITSDGWSLKCFTSCTVDNSLSTQVEHTIISHACTSTEICTVNSPENISVASPNVKMTDRLCGPNQRSCYFGGAISIFANEDSLKELCGVSLEVFSLLLGMLPTSSTQKEVTWDNKLAIFLMKLKLGINFSALGSLFGIHSTTASKHFYTVLAVVYQSTVNWIHWPSKHAVKDTLPNSFKEFYEDTRVVIDCTELKTEKPHGVNNQVLMYSQYKSAFTIKYLIGITPCGLICFLSKGYGGRATDSFITNDSSFLSKLEAGDVVMADKGFPQIENDVLKKDAILVMPPFADPDCKQFSSAEMHETHKIASVRIHVERVIQRVKLFDILKHRIKCSLFPSLDKIFHVCCVLVNLQPEIIAEDK